MENKVKKSEILVTLSAIGSSTLPRSVTWLWRRAKYPSIMSENSQIHNLHYLNKLN